MHEEDDDPEEHQVDRFANAQCQALGAASCCCSFSSSSLSIGCVQCGQRTTSRRRGGEVRIGQATQPLAAAVATRLALLPDSPSLSSLLPPRPAGLHAHAPRGRGVRGGSSPADRRARVSQVEAGVASHLAAARAEQYCILNLVRQLLSEYQTGGTGIVSEVLILEEMVSSIDNVRGLTLAISSSAFIGSSFVIKKVGLKKAGDSGVRAGSGGYSYLYEPLWWLGMITMILGEIANFAAYAFAPAVLVTPLGALSIIVSAVLAHFVLKEKLHMFGVVGCILCVVGSIGIVLHAPKEREIDSMKEIWHLATEPGFVVYSCVAVVAVLFLIFWVVERSGHRKMLVYIAICSTMGSLTVISVKAVAIALKLSFSGSNQFIYIQTWFFIVVVIICCLVQLNYLNKALDSFNTAVVSPVYYVMFTILTIVANMIMYKDSFSRDATQIATQLCGFVTIVAGTFLLHKTRDMGNAPQPPPDETCLDGEAVRPGKGLCWFGNLGGPTLSVYLVQNLIGFLWEIWKFRDFF
ncbi:hypothetical protein GUJ93_ZPchr0006g44869 [Zizania palustris]|uniref:Probable magnesium transporter n=1 Tax=Zizania palustris TaxID=103762 RepID=A0A8J5TBJ4_ZIZPA|nr:hypothetical protein GUJ93_ZPchr0006g44869 [Zizania palustris]